MTADRWFGVAIVLVSAGMVAEAFQIDVPFGQLGDPGPRIVPFILAAGLAILGLALILRRPAAASPVSADAAAAVEPDAGYEFLAPPAVPVRIALALAFITYIALFERIGFSIATFAFLAVSVFLLGRWDLRGAGIALAAAAITTLAVGTFLQRVIGVPLPGVLTF